MAEKRMFAKSIVLSDAFLDMPLSARCLYFTLGMLADDEGFVGNPKSIMRQCGASVDDMNVLISKRYVLCFDSGVIVIKHWRINNFLRNDRTHQTTYLEEKSTLVIDEKGAYTEIKNEVGIPTDNQVTTTCQPNDSERYTENRLDENRLDENSKYNVCFEEFWKHYPRKKEKKKAYAQYQARLKCGYSEEELLTACINYADECSKEKREERYIKLGATFLSANEPFRDYLKKGESADGFGIEQGLGESSSGNEERDREIEEILKRNADGFEGRLF